MWYHVYVLYSLKDNNLYIGFTTDLDKRLEQHNSGLNTSTKGRQPLKLIHSEAFINEQDARHQESYYKTGRGRETLRKILKETFIDIQKTEI